MHKNWLQAAKRISVFIGIAGLLTFLIRDFNKFSKGRKESDTKFEVFGNKYIYEDIIIQKLNNEEDYSAIYDILIKDLKVVEGSENSKIILVKENSPIFHDKDKIYISYDQYIDYSQGLKQKEKLLFLDIKIEDKNEYSKALKKIESITEWLKGNHNDLYSGLESIVYGRDKSLNFLIKGCKVKLIKIPHSFSKLNLKKIKDKFYNLESFIHYENKEIAQIQEIDLRWEDKDEGYIIWEN
mgnify:CR=1 FL=1